MVWSPSIATGVGVTAGVVSTLVALVAWRHRTSRAAIPFLALQCALAVWSVTYALQLGYDTLGAQLAWQRATLSVAGFVPVFWALFALAYTDHSRWLSRRWIAVFLLEPVAFAVLCLSNPVHQLVWTEAVLVNTAAGVAPALTFGPGYAIHIAFAYAVVGGGIALLVVHASNIAIAYQKQVGLLVTGAAPPFASHIAFTLGASPIPALDLTPFLFAFTGVVFGLALFRFDLLELAPIGRAQAFDELGDGLVVVSRDGEIADLIGIAATVLSPTPSVGDDVHTVFPETDLAALDGTELRATVDGEARIYQVQVSSISAHHDPVVGTLLILRDITGLRESRQRLSVTNRVLRHNLRNDMNVVLGLASDLEDRLDGAEAEDARTIRTTVEGFLELTDKADQIARVHDEDPGPEAEVDVREILRSEVGTIEAEYPTVAIDVEGLPQARVDNVHPETFRLAVRNVLQNAIKHNDADEPRVTIGVNLREASLAVEIADNGPGIPPAERSAIGTGLETPLEHSQGLGLWLTYWCVTRWGGTLNLESTAEGSTVTLTIPMAVQPGPLALPDDGSTA